MSTFVSLFLLACFSSIFFSFLFVIPHSVQFFITVLEWYSFLFAGVFLYFLSLIELGLVFLLDSHVSKVVFACVASFIVFWSWKGFQSIWKKSSKILILLLQSTLNWCNSVISSVVTCTVYGSGTRIRYTDQEAYSGLHN